MTREAPTPAAPTRCRRADAAALQGRYEKRRRRHAHDGQHTGGNAAITPLMPNGRYRIDSGVMRKH